MLVEEYLNLKQSNRQSHLETQSACIERGGNSTNHRGVLAQYLDTPIYGRPADLCHACGNDKCSNPNHLYWGTRSENVLDSKKHGTWKSPYESLVLKHGEDKAKQILKENLKDGCSRGGKAGKGKPKTPEHVAKVKASLIKKFGGVA